MFKIRAAQFNVMGEYTRMRFEDEMCTYLASNYTIETETWSSQKLLAWVQQNLERAKDYTLKSRYDLQRYLQFAIQNEMDMTHNGMSTWALKILEDSRLHPSEKMDRIDDAEPFQR